MFDGQYKSRLGRIVSSWRASGRPSTRAALDQNPELRSKGAYMDLVLAEYKMRRDSGEQLVVTRFCDQFSTYRDELRELLHVEDGISKLEQQQQVHWPNPGETFLEFSLQSILGVGAASRVYLARQTTLGNRLVALKVTPFGSSEAQTLGKLRHRNVVPVLSIHDDPERQLWAVCMPYLGSATLLDVRNHAFKENQTPAHARLILEAAARDSADTAPTKPIDVLQNAPAVLRSGRYYEGIAYVGAELAEGLAYTHLQGVLHRDLKPSNILITSDGCPMLLDFNLAWDAQRESFRLGGTVPYMPPEQLYATFLAEDEEDEQPPDDPRSDVFALGVILFELLTGRLPFAIHEQVDLSDTINELMRQQLLGAPKVRDLVPAVPRKLAALVDQCLLVELSGRPQPAQLAEKLRRCGIRPQLRGKRSRAFTATVLAVSTALLLAASFGVVSLVANYRNAGEVVDTYAEYLERAKLRMEQSLYDLAAEDLRLANTIRPNSLVRAYQAYCHGVADNHNEARAILAELLAERGDDPDVLNNYAQALMAGGNFSAARGYLDAALKIDPVHAHALYNRARCNLFCNPEEIDSDGGLEFALKAISLFPVKPSSIYLTTAHLSEQASTLGKMSPAESKDLTRKMLHAAVEANCSRTSIETQPRFKKYSEEDWYNKLLSNATNVDVIPSFSVNYCKPREPLP